MSSSFSDPRQSQLMLCLPIPTPFPFEPDLHKLQNDCLTELAAYSNRLQMDCLDRLELSVYESPDAHPVIGRTWKAPSRVRQQHHLLTIAANGSRSVDRITAQLKVSEDDNVRKHFEELVVDLAVEELKMEANNLLLLANLLRPGSISASNGYVVCDEAIIAETAPFYATDLYRAVEAANAVSWPSFQTVPFGDAWTWLQKSACVIDGIGKGSLGRAWAALSHVTADSLNETSTIDLVWILMGLEALYTRGVSGLKDQLAQKTEILLGPRQKSKKAFGAVYDYRSRLLHGDIDLPVRYTRYSAVNEYMKFHDDLYRNEALALAVLIATMQVMASRRWSELNFSYSLSGRVLDE